MIKLTFSFPKVKKGGPGSGHHGHEGRPGHKGGSLPGEGWSSISADSLKHAKIGDKYLYYTKAGKPIQGEIVKDNGDGTFQVAMYTKSGKLGNTTARISPRFAHENEYIQSSANISPLVKPASKIADADPYPNAPKPKHSEREISKLESMGDVKLYHITSPENVNSIADGGLIPQDRPSGQTWSATHSNYATYYHASPGGARYNLNDVEELVGYKPPMIVVRYDVSTTSAARSFARRLLPDEDSSSNINDGIKALSLGNSVAVVGGARRSDISAIVVDKRDTEINIEKLRASGVTVVTYDEYDLR